MCTLRSFGKILLLILGAATFASGAMAADEPLPLEIQLDLENVAFIEDLGAQRAELETKLNDVLGDWIRQRLQQYWTVGEPGAEHILRLSIEIDPPETPPLFSLQIAGNESRFIDDRGREPAKRPRDGAVFIDALVDQVQDFLRGHGGDLSLHSKDVHAAATFGSFTNLTLSRVLSADDQIRYLPDGMTVKWKHKSFSEPISRQPAGPFETSVYVPPNSIRIAELRPRPYTAYRAPDEIVAQLCIQRPGIADGPFQPKVMYECPVSGRCAMKATNPPDWARDYCAQSGRSDGDSLWQYIVGTAHAREGTAWEVPSLNTLYDRLLTRGTRFVGFTEFEISAPELSGLDADAYTVSLAANGVPIRINGLPPKDDLRGLDTRDGLSLRFGLENLQFAGREDGCEKITAVLQFMKEDKPVGNPLTLERSYVALRDAPPVAFRTDFGTFDWTGRYMMPDNQKELGMFILSRQYPRNDPELRAEALADLNKARATFDRFGWTIAVKDLGGEVGLETAGSDSGPLSIVGKIRPPRTEFADGNVAYGLEVGVEEPNGQLQFTFDMRQINALKQRLLGLRAETPEARNIVPAKNGFFVYQYTPERRKSAPDWVCHE